jgi:site-specific recombinase XerD
VSCHTLRQSFTTQLLEDGHDIRTIQECFGQRNVSTTMTDSRVLNWGERAVHHSVDRL